EAPSNTAKLPGFHTQLERLNEVLTANKPEANSMRRKKCTGAEVDKTSGNHSTSGDSSDHQTCKQKPRVGHGSGGTIRDSSELGIQTTFQHQVTITLSTSLYFWGRHQQITNFIVHIKGQVHLVWFAESRDIEADKIIFIQRGHSARFGAARVGMSGHRVLVLEGNHRAQGSRVQIHEGPQRVSVRPSTQSQGDSQDVNTKQRVFVLSSIESNQAREHYASIIVALGGQVSDKPSFDPATTHLVCDRPVRSEKLLANIAAGNWVLHTSYLFKSHDGGTLPSCKIEEQFEWGNPDSSAVLSHIKQDNHIALLAKAVHRWRVKLSRAPVGVGAFSGMRVLVNVGKDRGDQFKRLILAGGGQVVSLSLIGTRLIYDDYAYRHHISLRQVLSATETTRLANAAPFQLPPLVPANTTNLSFPPPPSPNFIKPMLLALSGKPGNYREFCNKEIVATLPTDWQTATMCLVDPSKVSLDKPISLASFATHNIPCVPTLFLNDYLVMDTPPSMSESAIPQYKEVCRQLKS
ncbi:unnamed protein product, partial [Timema podura]|nr:unnamed protein product [Timema podura]